MSLRNRFTALFLALAVSACGFARSQSFDPEAYLRHVRHLAGDEMKGRGNGTPELDAAAAYIAAQFRSAGLTPAGDGGSYFQKFMLTTGAELGTGNKLTVRLGTRIVEGELHKDFAPFGIGEKVSLDGPIVFAGYGISAEEYGYDDYKDLDVTGKVVLVMAHEPRENDDAGVFNGRQMTMHAEDNTKAINAKYRNAAAVLIVQDPANHPDPGGDLPDARLEIQVDELGICAVRITRALAQQILAHGGQNLLDLQRGIDESMAPRSLEIGGSSAALSLDVIRRQKEVSNVVGLLPGTDPRLGEEAVVIGAHYDHIGLGGKSSREPGLIGQIHNGADDNASGTAGLIELAAALARDGAARKRSYLFIAFAGEELGLNGSAWWADNPSRPLDKVVAMINMDMIGRAPDGQVLVGGSGTAPEFPDLLKRAAENAGLEMKTSPSGYGSSDHQSFYTRNVPVLFFFSGLHADYHRPTDDWDKINTGGAVRILEMVRHVAEGVNAAEGRPRFTKVDEPTAGPVRGGAGYGTYFGSVPDMTDETAGVRFSDVRPNSPAAKAGLRAQDILVAFEGKEVKNLQDFTYMLRTYKPGDTVEVTVLREGKPFSVQVKLEARR